MIKKTILAALLTAFQLLTSCASDLPSVKQSTESYLIGSGDVLAIDVWREEALSKQVSVRLDGKISLPLIDDIQTVGLTCGKLENLIEEKYTDFVEVPEVSVTLLQSGSGKIYMLGKIQSPGEHPLTKKMTVLQAISRAGGLGPWADTSDIRLIRKIGGVERHFRIDYEAIISGEDMSHNILLEPGDTIFVP
ncbi:MAG: polysaccharide biosynthesis/export family protein [Deltaproteobacteria bacterium]|nr:polysaccharide biosynthesis/export family protein [Deltaproteobacteria bacterium]